MKNITSIILFLFLLAGLSYSQVVEIRGIGDAKTVDEKGVALPEGEAANKAIREAAINGIDKVLEQQSIALRQQFNERARDNDKIIQLLTDIISNAKVTTTALPDQKMTRATLAGSFDIHALRDILNTIPKSPGKADGRSGDNVAVFFTVRSTVKTSREDSSSDKNLEIIDSSETGSEKIEDGAISIDEKNRREKIVTDISKIDIGAEITKLVPDPQYKPQFGTGLLTQLSAKGFKDMTDGSFFESSEQMDKDILESNGLKAGTWRSLMQEIKNDGDNIEVVIVGSLDFAMPTIDPVSGLSLVEATMSAKVYRIVEGKKQPSFVAGLAPKTAKGVGPSQENAKQSALNTMSVLAADEIITALKNNEVIN
jgi:hypothetical protein